MMNTFSNKILAGGFALVASGAVMFAMPGSANATTISGGSASISNTLTDFTTKALGTLNLFDSTLGTLTSVSFTTTYGFSSTITVSASSDALGNAKTESAASYQSSNSAVNAVLNALVNTNGTVIIGSSTLTPTAYDQIGNPTLYTIAAGGSQQITSSKADANLNFSTSNASFLAAFSAVGGGTFAVSGSTLTGTTNQVTSGNASASQVTYADEGISVSYTYDVAPPVGVPEPASMALLGAGLLGVGLIRRKKA